MSAKRKETFDTQDPEETACSVREAIQRENDLIKTHELFSCNKVCLHHVCIIYTATYSENIVTWWILFFFFWLSYALKFEERVCFGCIQNRGHQSGNGSLNHNSHDKDENRVALAMKRITYMGSRYSYWVNVFISFWAVVFHQMVRQILIMADPWLPYCLYEKNANCHWSHQGATETPESIGKTWCRTQIQHHPKCDHRLLQAVGEWVMLLSIHATVTVAETKEPLGILCMMCVDIAEKADCSGGHHCFICYHGDPVQLGEHPAGRLDWVAVFLPEKQEAVRVTSRSRHP